MAGTREQQMVQVRQCRLCVATDVHYFRYLSAVSDRFHHFPAEASSRRVQNSSYVIPFEFGEHIRNFLLSSSKYGLELRTLIVYASQFDWLLIAIDPDNLKLLMFFCREFGKHTNSTSDINEARSASKKVNKINIHFLGHISVGLEKGVICDFKLLAEDNLFIERIAIDTLQLICSIVCWGSELILFPH